MSHNIHSIVLYSIMVFMILINEWRDKVKAILLDITKGQGKFLKLFSELNQILKPYITIYAKNGFII